MAARKERPSRIDELHVRKLVEDMFESKATLADIAAAVKQVTGEEISEMALSRAHKKWDRERISAEASEREVEELMQALSGNPDLDIKKSVLGVFWAKVAKRFAQANLTFDKADALDMSHLLLKAFRTEQMGGQLDVQQERLELLRDKIKGVADKVADEGRRKGLDEETIRKIREDIYGLTPVNT